MKFDPTIAIIVLAFFTLFCSSFYSACKRRRLTSRDNSTTFRLAGVTGETVESAQGLERSVIESFPVFSYNLMKGINGCAECAVCLIDFEDREMLRLLPKCNHVFHPECIDTWLRTNTTCPICRTSLLLSTDLGVGEPQTSSEQLTIDVTDNGGTVSSQGNDFSNEATIGTEGKREPSSSLGLPAYSKSGSFAENRSKSERWGNISIHPASFLRTFSMHVTVGEREGDGTERSQG